MFKVSEQRRDGRGQMTFKIKEEFITKLDPFLYINPASHSKIFQMYEQYYKDKPGVNDIVGEYSPKEINYINL